MKGFVGIIVGGITPEVACGNTIGAALPLAESDDSYGMGILGTMF